MRPGNRRESTREERAEVRAILTLTLGRSMQPKLCSYANHTTSSMSRKLYWFAGWELSDAFFVKMVLVCDLH